MVFRANLRPRIWMAVAKLLWIQAGSSEYTLRPSSSKCVSSSHKLIWIDFGFWTLLYNSSR